MGSGENHAATAARISDGLTWSLSESGAEVREARLAQTQGQTGHTTRVKERVCDACGRRLCDAREAQSRATPYLSRRMPAGGVTGYPR